MTKKIIIVHKAKPTGGSDLTLKKDIVEIKNALDIIKALNPVTWLWKDDKKDSNNTKQHGFIAQEVEKVLPELVEEGTWEDGTKRKFLATDSIMPYLVSAIKEQQLQITKLEKMLKKLQKNTNNKTN